MRDLLRRVRGVARSASALVVALVLLVDVTTPCSGATARDPADAHHAAMAAGHGCGHEQGPRLVPRCECGCLRDAPSAVGLGPAHPAVLASAPALVDLPPARHAIVELVGAARAVGRAIDHVPRLLG